MIFDHLVLGSFSSVTPFSEVPRRLSEVIAQFRAEMRYACAKTECRCSQIKEKKRLIEVHRDEVPAEINIAGRGQSCGEKNSTMGRKTVIGAPTSPSMIRARARPLSLERTGIVSC